MRWLLTFPLILFYITATTQIRFYKKNEVSIFLVAKNSKREHWYREGKALTILYTDGNGNIVKAKGYLYIHDSTHIELERRSGRITTVIDPDNIISVQKWSGPLWVAMGITAGIGAAIAIPTFTAIASGTNNILLIFPAILAIADAYFVATDIPVIIISEALSVRSKRKGYHFTIKYY